MGNEQGEHELRCQKTGMPVYVNIVSHEDRWRFYSERLGWSDEYDSSDVALAYAQKIHNARRI